tara:strand:+ start:1648 stop:2562 length:915 start_codon:yes stop_codon:yes gene_type:complete
MKLGFLTAPFPRKSLIEVSEWAVQNKFESIEIACWPKDENKSHRRYAGTSHIDIKNISQLEASELALKIKEMGLLISGLGYYPNPLHPEPNHRLIVFNHLKKLITCASWMGVPIVNTFCGGDSSLTVDENWIRAKQIWPEYISFAQDHGVQLAFENCPMIFSKDEWPAGHNIAYSPNLWRRIITEWDGAVGINFDPSHLIWQMIDQTRFIREFGSNIHHVHAKDLRIDKSGIYDYGIMSAGIGWQIPCVTGFGDVNWNNFFKELEKANYNGAVIIEHEDKNFEANDRLIKQGLLIAKENLALYI